MLAIALTLGTLISIMFFFVGGVMGWMLKQYLLEKNYVAYTHPEMFDENGNVIPDEIVAVRFENDYDYDEDDEEEGND